jgi:hypothetical protein
LRGALATKQSSFLSAAPKLDCFAKARNDDLGLFFHGCLKIESEKFVPLVIPMGSSIFAQLCRASTSWPEKRRGWPGLRRAEGASAPQAGRSPAMAKN